ncbi:uncharacterized protein KY384_005050 [Bacidia gigantensis]|uniref:uncharacterized protein n=1 Tax=Bacidia gigantensis TaxID=2732470 RepID=UPI001D047E1E|nr:uncharacterized protein KY384_005050 [Bacidia gigantensis]KAG8530547.1 hypothetical protein KY384_005050 [Bacidia gigantensis]
MEVIVRNLDQHMTESRVEKFFKPILKSYGIDHFHCQKLKAKGCATFTVLDPLKCQRFLYFHGQVQPGRKGFNAVRRKLFIQKNPVNCMVSTNAPNEWIVFALRKEESDRHAALSRKALTPGKVESRSEVLRPRAFDISRMQVGQLWYSGGNLVFSDNYADHRTGRIIFGSRSLLIKLWPMQPGQAHYQLQIWYDSIESFVVGDNCVTLSLIQAPRLFENLDGDISLEASLRKALGIQAGPTFKPMQSFKRTRLSALNDKHREVVASCFCYRLTLTSLTDSRAVQGLKGFEGIPNIVIWNIPVQLDIPIPEQMAALQCGLAEVRYGGAMPFEVKFQLQKLAQNTYLKPTKVIELFPCVRSHLRERSVAIVASALRHLASSIPFAGPDAEEENFKVNTLTSLLQKSIESVFEDDPYSLRLAEEHDHIAMVHKALVTPTGIFLYGPEPETKNRILRKYSTHLDNFISVSFVDENYEHLRFERDTSSEDIYQRRFQGILDGFITIAGRNYEFLGFSHSSLRGKSLPFYDLARVRQPEHGHAEWM